MLAFVLISGVVLLLIGLARLTKAGGQTPPPQRRKRDHGGSGVVMMDGAPLLGPDDGSFGMGAGAVHFDTQDNDDTRFHAGGGSSGGAGASGGWDENSIDDGGWDGGDGDGDGSD